MKSYTAAEYAANPQLDAQFKEASEFLDGRFAFIGEQLFEVLEYKGCPDGFDYAILQISKADEVYGPESLTDSRRDFPLQEVWLACTNDEPDAIHKKFIAVMQEALGLY